MALDWWVLVPVAEKDIRTRPADAIVYSVQQGSDTDNSWIANNQSPAVTVNGKQYVPLIGPFSSQAEAQSTQVQNPGPGAGIIPGIVGGATGNLGAGIGLPNPFQGISDTAHAIAAIGAFFVDAWKILTNVKMWRSLGWLILGILLMLAGVLWWIGPSASRAGPLGVAQGIGRRLYG